MDIEEGEILGDEVLALHAEWRSTLRTFEESNEYLICKFQTRSNTSQELRANIVQLQKLKLSARYGDMFAIACKMVRNRAQESNLAGAPLLEGYWTDISRRLRQEQPKWELLMKTRKHEEGTITLHQTLLEACNGTGFELDDIITIIYMYSDSNEEMHSNLLPLVQDVSPISIATELDNGLNDLPAIIPPGNLEYLQILQTLINAMIDSWFVKYLGFEKKTERWTPTPALNELMDYVAATESDIMKQLERYKKAEVEVIKTFRMRLAPEKLGVEFKEAYQKLEEMSEMIIAQPVSKREASANYTVQEAKAKRQKTLWKKLTTTTHKALSLGNEWTKEFGGMKIPDEVVEDKFGETEYHRRW
ncbi:uncharacterized protein L3040_003765 [Drepanopeziza brunnea f. sp. 'multigermtubi']|uniref:uncharacterized protein n=1 Tax=Drepanopeziza brunnea f. sp. 'multigermtubi' TaxID=698441 RepID=UPI00239C187C|nr:hypothetical protein L3040_003765 [Drepanopeziza brunnea f. sp. 'multigermtubi']